MSRTTAPLGSTVAVLVAVGLAAPTLALVPPAPGGLHEKVFRSPVLADAGAAAGLDDLDSARRSELAAELTRLGVIGERAQYDPRADLWTGLILRRPLLPGRGEANGLTWASLGRPAPASPREWQEAAIAALTAFLDEHRGELAIDVAELAAITAAVHDGGDLIQVTARRIRDGIPVRDSFLQGVIRFGNLILYGASHWGPVTASAVPSVGPEAAAGAVGEHLEGIFIDAFKGAPRLVYVPAHGRRYEFRLAWQLHPRFAGDAGSWEALIDAHTGELLSFEDRNAHASTRQVEGGVLPITTDHQGPDSTEQADWPMPFAQVRVDGTGEEFVTDTGGNLQACVEGDITSAMDSRFVRMLDRCNPNGTPAEVGSSILTGLEDVDYGVTFPEEVLGTNCAPVIDPATSNAPGNTRASRTGFYEVNKIKEQARGQLPANLWLQDQLTANMNIPNACNAFWNGVTINFYQNTAACSNSGEIAAVFDHEWGHGMDNNDATGTIARPGQEGIADAYMALRLNTSCVGRNFSAALGCNSPARGYGDPCINDCDGVRDVNYHNRTSGVPHGMEFARMPGGVGGMGCGSDPTISCDGLVHCEGALVSEMIWDLMRRDLPCHGSGWIDDGGPFDGPVEGGDCVGGAAPTMDPHTALELTTRLTYLGGGAASQWFECTDPIGGGGCNTTYGYFNYLAVDDDNGDLSDGTPHMTAIFDAMNRHDLACADPLDPLFLPVADSGCVGAPTVAPNVVATAFDRGVELEWAPVPGAARYQVLRTEGVFQCDFGKTLVGEVADAECDGLCSFVDFAGLRNGFEYFYTVVGLGNAAGSDLSCLGPAAACTAASPVAGVNLAIDEASAAVATATGDGDPFLDNCESADITFDIVNIGSGPQSNVRVVAFESTSHPGIQVHTDLPLVVGDFNADCDLLQAQLAFTAAGLAFQDTVEFRVAVTSDELDALGIVKSGTLTLSEAESDFQGFATLTWDFEDGEQGWQEIRGTFDRTGGDGANGSAFFIASSAFLDGQCDQIRSPLLRLSTTSTLSLYNRFGIEPVFETGVFYDRANVGLLDVEADTRTSVSPDGGRLYNASGVNGTCGTENQEGWADTMDAWAQSTWSASALEAAAFAGRPTKLAIHYGTDPTANDFGFHFDDVTLTDFELQVADTQDDACSVLGCTVAVPLASGFFEAGDLSEWDQVRNPQGDLTVAAAAALEGSFGMQVAIEHDPPLTIERPAFVSQIHEPVSNYCWQVLFDPNALVMDDNQTVTVWEGRATGSQNQRVLEMTVHKLPVGSATPYAVRLKVFRDDLAGVQLPLVGIPDAPLLLGGEWSVSAEGGVLRLFADGRLAAEQTGIQGVTRLVRRAGLGNVAVSTGLHSGVVRFDAFTAGWTPP